MDLYKRKNLSFSLPSVVFVFEAYLTDLHYSKKIVLSFRNKAICGNVLEVQKSISNTIETAKNLIYLTKN